MEFDYSKLKGRIIEKFGSQNGFADALGVAFTVVSAKLTGLRAITKNDIIGWSNLLEIPVEEIGVYFFKLKVKEA